GMESNKTGGLFKNRALDVDAVDRIDPIQDEEPELGASCRFEAMAHGGDVSVKAAANILDIEDQRVQIAELIRCRSLPFPIQTVDRQPRCLIHAIGHLLVQSPADAMLWAKKSFKRHVGGAVKQVDRRTALAVDAAMVRDQSNFEPLEWSEVFGREYVDP